MNLLDIDRTDIIIGGDHGQGSFRFPINILYIINNEKIHEIIQLVGYILCKKDDGLILENTIIKDLGDSINLLNKSMLFNNQQLSPSNIYVTGDLVCFVILLRKECASPHWCIKFKLPSKY